MECKDLRELVVRHSSGELSGDEWGLVESHLSGCGECSELFSHSNAVWMLLDEWKEIEPRNDYVSEFWSRVERKSRALGSGARSGGPGQGGSSRGPSPPCL